jgi:hypothetical protein
MLRFLTGDRIDIFVLARNALTSVDMLEKHYLSHAENKMKIKELQSFAGGRPRYKLADPSFDI